MSRLRVAFVAGGLEQGGAEKQLVSMATALLGAGAEVRVYCLTRGDHYEARLRELGLEPIWIGGAANPLLRLLALAAHLRRYRPAIVQASHFFVNLHAAGAGRFAGAPSIGALRNDLYHEIAANGAWSPLLVRAPSALLANSYAGYTNALRLGVRPESLHLLENVIDLAEFDHTAGPVLPEAEPYITATLVARLVPQKRVERFIAALALARRSVPQLRGLIVGAGPLQLPLEALAQSSELRSAGALCFAGRRDDVPALLRQSSMLVLCSDQEGFPNVLLEAMAAGLPVVTTAAGDAARIVADGCTGFVVPCDDPTMLSRAMMALATAPALRQQMGVAGRARVVERYNAASLAYNLLAIYTTVLARTR